MDGTSGKTIRCFRLFRPFRVFRVIFLGGGRLPPALQFIEEAEGQFVSAESHAGAFRLWRRPVADHLLQSLGGAP